MTIQDSGFYAHDEHEPRCTRAWKNAALAGAGPQQLAKHCPVEKDTGTASRVRIWPKSNRKEWHK